MILADPQANVKHICFKLLIFFSVFLCSPRATRYFLNFTEKQDKRSDLLISYLLSGLWYHHTLPMISKSDVQTSLVHIVPRSRTDYLMLNAAYRATMRVAQQLSNKTLTALTAQIQGPEKIPTSLHTPKVSLKQVRQPAFKNDCL